MHSQRLLLVLSLGASLASADVKAPVRKPQVGIVVILVLIGVVLDLVISVALGYAVTQARHNASALRVSQIAAYEVCLQANRSADADLQRWNEVLSLVARTPSTPGQTRFIQGVQAANATADAHHICAPLKP